MIPKVTNEGEAELLRSIWKEQVTNARRFIVEARKRNEPRDRYRIEGVAFVVLNLHDQFSDLLQNTPQKAELDSDYLTFTDRLTQN